jgi:hypothetical protein
VLVALGQGPGNPKISYQRAPVGREEQILRLDVTVDDAMVVRVIKCPRGVARDSKSIVNCELPLSSVAQALPFNERHREPELPLGFTRVVHGKDVRMLEAGSQFDLALEAFGTEREGQFRMQDLQGDRTVVPDIMGQKYSGHAATPKLPLDAVAIGKAAPELLG